MYFHSVISMYPFLIYWLHSKANAINHTTRLCFCKGLAMSQSILQTGTTKNDEQYTLSIIINIEFQNCHFFIEVYFEVGTL